MHRIDSDGSVDGLFVDGNEPAGIEGTRVPASWLNDLQENIIAVLEAAGINPTKGRAADLLDSINKLIASGAGNDLADIDALMALTGSTAAVVKVLSGGGDGRGDYWFRDPYDETTPHDGVNVVVDADGVRWKKQLNASFIPYEDGSTIQSLRPAEFGADITGNHTSANTLAVGGSDATVIETGALAGKDVSDALENYGLGQSIADFVEAANLAGENTSLAAVNVNEWNSLWTTGRRSHAFNIAIDRQNQRFTLRHRGFAGHTGVAFMYIELEIIGNTISSLNNVSSETPPIPKGSDIVFTGDGDKNLWGPNGLMWEETISDESDDRIDFDLAQPIDGNTLFRLRFRRMETTDIDAISYFVGGDTPVLARIAPPVSMVMTPLDNHDKDVLLMTNAPADAGATNRKTFTQGTEPSQPGDDLHEGDLWIDTSDSNKMYRWSGASWVDIRDAGAAAGEGIVDGTTVIHPDSLDGVNIGQAQINLGNLIGGASLVKWANSLLLSNNAGFESGTNGQHAIPYGWFREGSFSESRTQYYQEADPDSIYGSSLSYGALTSPLNGGEVGWWALGKKFSIGTTGLSLNVSAKVKLVNVGNIPSPTGATLGSQTWMADDDAFIEIRCFRANGTAITLADSVRFSTSASEQSELSGTGHSGKWFDLNHSVIIPPETFRVDVFLVAVDGGDAVRSLGYKGTNNALVLMDDFFVEYEGIYNEVTEATWASEPGATHGASWGQNISGQPDNEDLLNAYQLWSDISGNGKPQDNATNHKVFTQPTPPENPADDIHLGDLWIDDNDANHLYRWNGTSWVSVRDTSITDALNAVAGALAGTATGAITTFFETTTPFGNADGDLWFDTSDNNKLYRFSLTSPQKITGNSSHFTENLGDWVDVSDAGSAIQWDSVTQAMDIVSIASETAMGSLEITDLTIGDKYTLRFNINSLAGDIHIGVGTTATGNEVYSETKNAPGLFRDYFTATAPTHYVTISTSDGDTAEVDLITLRKSGEWQVAQDGTIGELVSNLATVESIADSKIKTYFRTTAPTNPADEIDEGDLWWNPALSRLYRWDSGTSAWVIASIQGTSELVDDAALGENAIWANVIGAGKPEDNATNRKILVSSTPPSLDLHEGDLWYDTDDGNKQYWWDGSSWEVVQDSGAAAGQSLNQALADAGLGQNIADLVNDANVARSTYSLAGVNVNDWSVIYPGGGYRGVFISISIDRNPLSPNFKHVIIGFHGRNGHLGTGNVSFELEVNNNTVSSFSNINWATPPSYDAEGVNFASDSNVWGSNGLVTSQTITNAIDREFHLVLTDDPDPSTVFRFKLRGLSTTDGDGRPYVTFGDKLVAGSPNIPFQTLFNAADGSDYDVLLMTNGPTHAGATNHKTYSQGTDPDLDPSADLHIGDLWVNTSEGNKLYRWDGSQWLLVQDSGAAAGEELRDALIDAGLGQSIADIVSVTNKSSESWPLGSVNVNDWAGEYISSKRGPHFNIKVNGSDIIIKHHGTNAHDGESTINVEVQVQGISVVGYTKGTSDVTLSPKGGPVDFGTDTNTWGSNGISWNESLNNLESHTQIISLASEPDDTTVIRLRIREFSTDDSLATTIFSLGDTAIAANIDAPKEVFFSFIDGTYYDVLIMQNAPAAAGANVTAPSITIKKNYSDFSTVNTGEMYIHGFNNAGNPADEDGYITYNGQKLIVPKQVVNTSVTASGYLFLDTNFTNRFEMEDGSLTSIVFAVKNRGNWFYDDNEKLVAFTPQDGDLVIGTVIANTDNVLEATAWGYGMAPGVVSDAGATNHKTFSQSTEPTDDLHEGDIWIDTSSGNLLYRWDGNDWVSLQDAGAAAGAALEQALNDAGLDGDIAEFVVNSNRAALYSGPSSLNNVVEWDEYATPNQTSHLLHLRINKTTKVVTVTFAGINSPISESTIKVEIEVMGNNIVSWNKDTFDGTYVNKLPGALDFEDTWANEVGSNGLRFSEATTTILDTANFTLQNPITGSTVFRMKINQWNYPNKAFVIFGDTPVMVGPTAPVEFFFSPLDSHDYDVLVMKNAPADPGATNRKTIPSDTPPDQIIHDLHIGDLWFDTSDSNKMYRWSGTDWIMVRDEGIDEALQAASNAEAAVDGKINSFYQSTPPSEADEGDIWFDTSSGNKIYYRVGSDWVVAQDTSIADALDAANDAHVLAEGKITTFFGTMAPTATASGDLWYNSSDKKMRRWDGSNWVIVSTAVEKTSELDDDAGLGETADWDKVSGPGKPQDNADVTGENTSADTDNVNGTPSDVVSKSSGSIFRSGYETIEVSDWSVSGTATLTAATGGTDVYSGTQSAQLSASAAASQYMNLVFNDRDPRVSYEGVNSPNIQIENGKFVPFKTWNFNGSTEGWGVAGGTISSASGYMRWAGTANNSYIRSPVISVDGSRDHVIRLRLRRVSGSTFIPDMRYSTSDHGEDTSYRIRDTTTTIGSDWFYYDFDCFNLTSGEDDWRNNIITRFRIYLSSVQQTWEIESISIGRYEIDRLWPKGNSLIRLHEGYQTSSHYFRYITTKQTGVTQQYTASAILKAGSHNIAGIGIQGGEGSTVYGSVAFFNLSTGAFDRRTNHGPTALTDVTYSSTELGDGWWLIRMTATLPSAADTARGYIQHEFGGNANYKGENRYVYYYGSSFAEGTVTEQYVTNTGEGSKAGYGIDLNPSYVKVAIPQTISTNFVGEKVRISAFVKQPTSGSSAFAMRYGAGGYGFSEWSVHSIDSTWKRLEYVIDVPEAATPRSDEIHFSSCGGGNVLVDNVRVEVVTKPAEVDGAEILNADQLISSVQISINENLSMETIFDGTDDGVWKDAISTTVTTTGDDLVNVSGVMDLYIDTIVDDTDLVPYTHEFNNMTDITVSGTWSVSGGSLRKTASGAGQAVVTIRNLTPGDCYQVDFSVISTNGVSGLTVSVHDDDYLWMPYSTMDGAGIFSYPSRGKYIFMASKTTARLIFNKANINSNAIVDITNLKVTKTLTAYGGESIQYAPNAPGPGGPKIKWRLVRNFAGSPQLVLYESDGITISSPGSGTSLVPNVVDTSPIQGLVTYTFQMQWMKGSYSAGQLESYDLPKKNPLLPPSTATHSTWPFAYIRGTGTQWAAYVGVGWELIIGGVRRGIVAAVNENRDIIMDVGHPDFPEGSSSSPTNYELRCERHRLIARRGRTVLQAIEYRN